jgi:hypothetical protein
MNIIIEMTLAEFQFRRKGFWRETSDKYMWVILSLLLIGAAFVRESSIAIPNPGNIKAKIGGPVSWFGTAGAFGLFVYERRKYKQTKNLVGEIHGDKTVFMRFSESGIEYGIRDVGTRFCSWAFVTRIEIKPHTFEFELPYSSLDVRTETLKPEEAAALKEFIGTQRDLILPEPFFGWRRSTPGKESYGPVKR